MSLSVHHEVEGRAQRAKDFYARACVLGSAVACTNYGAGVLNASADPSEERTCAQRIFERTCRAGEIEWGCPMLAPMIAPEDPERALELANRSCEETGRFGCRVLAIGWSDGWFGEPNPALAEAAHRRACANGQEDSCAELAEGAR